MWTFRTSFSCFMTLYTSYGISSPVGPILEGYRAYKHPLSVAYLCLPIRILFPTSELVKIYLVVIIPSINIYIGLFYFELRLFLSDRALCCLLFIFPHTIQNLCLFELGINPCLQPSHILVILCLAVSRS
jgi:hypothetical protein